MTQPSADPAAGRAPGGEAAAGRAPGGEAAASEAAVGDLGYEQARDALVDVVRRLEAGSATLEESLALWERGEALATRCEQWLAGARSRLDAAIANSAGDRSPPAAPPEQAPAS